MDTPEDRGSTPELLRRLDRWLARERSDYYAALRPGCRPEALDAFEKRLSLRLPEPLRLLYRWRDGQRPDCSASLQQNMMFSPLEEIAESKEILDGMIGEDFESPDWWRREWVPFLSNGGGDHLCMDLGEGGRIITFYHDWENRPVRFPDFEAWLADLVASAEGGTLEMV